MSTMTREDRQIAAREARLRRLARRQDLLLKKSRTRIWESPYYGGFWIINPYFNCVVYPSDGYPTTDLDEIEDYLREEPSE